MGQYCLRKAPKNVDEPIRITVKNDQETKVYNPELAEIGSM